MPKRSAYKSYAWTHPKTGKMYARVQIKQEDGKYKTYLKPAKNKKHADQLATEMLGDYAVRKTGFIEGEAMTFAELADWYRDKFAVPPVYSDDGEKVSGMRTHQIVRNRLEHLKSYFGKLLVKTIDDETIARYKKKREKEELKAASINRDLEILRAMFRKAVRKRWLRESPFDYGEKLIEKALEKKRSVVLTADQEFAILECARRSEKSLLYYAILCLLDTGARPSEIYDASTEKAEPVKWKDFFEFEFQAVRLTSYKGKQKLVRFAPVTGRLESAMRELWNNIPEKDRDVNSQIFPVASFKTAWGKARAKADLYLKIAAIEKMDIESVFALDQEALKELKEKIEAMPEDKLPPALDVRLRDLRRNLSTRLATGGMENDLRQQILGHTKAQTTFEYTEADLRTALAAKRLLDDQLRARTIVRAER